MRYLLERHPYIEAHDKFVRGLWTREQAAAFASRDLDFIATVEVDFPKFDRVYDAALHVINTKWVPEAVAYARAHAWRA